MSRPVVLLDVDGVSASFIAGALSVIKEITGRDHAHDDVHLPFIEKALGLSDGEARAMYAAVERQGWCRSLPVYEGAREGVAELSTFADVHPVTSHFLTSPYWAYERDEWIVENLGLPKESIVHTHSKHIIDGDIFVDDMTKHVIRWSARHPRGTAVLFRRRYNAGDEWQGVRVDDWPHLVRFARSRLGVDA